MALLAAAALSVVATALILPGHGRGPALHTVRGTAVVYEVFVPAAGRPDIGNVRPPPAAGTRVVVRDGANQRDVAEARVGAAGSWSVRLPAGDYWIVLDPTPGDDIIEHCVPRRVQLTVPAVSVGDVNASAPCAANISVRTVDDHGASWIGELIRQMRDMRAAVKDLKTQIDDKQAELDAHPRPGVTRDKLAEDLDELKEQCASTAMLSYNARLEIATAAGTDVVAQLRGEGLDVELDPGAECAYTPKPAPS